MVAEGNQRAVWDAFHPAVLYAYLPPEWRVKFLAATAKRFHKSGWVIAEKAFDAAPWIENYKLVYNLTDEKDYGTYHAYHFLPKAGAP